MNPNKDEGSESYYEEEILEEYEEFLEEEEEEEDGPGMIRSAAVGNETAFSTPPVASSPALPMHPMVAALKGGNGDANLSSSRPSHPMVAALKASNGDTNPSSTRASHTMVAALNGSSDDTKPASSRPTHPMVTMLNGSGSSDQIPPLRPVHPMVAAMKGGNGQDIAAKAPPSADMKQQQALPFVPASNGVPSRPPHPLFGGGGGGGLNDLQSAIRKAATDRNARVEKEGINEPTKEGKSKLVPVQGRVSGSQSATGARTGGGSGDTSASLADQVAMLAAKRNQRRAADISKSSGATGDEASTVISELSVPKSFVSTKAVVPYDTRKQEYQQQKVPRPMSSTPEVLPFKSSQFVPKQPVTIPKRQSSQKSISASTPISAVVLVSTSTSQLISIEPEPLNESSSTETGQENNESSSKSVPVVATHDDKESVSNDPTSTDPNKMSGEKGGWFGKSQIKSAPTTATAPVSSSNKSVPPKQTIPAAVENKSTEFQKISLKPVSTSTPPTTNAVHKQEQALNASAPFGQGMLKPVGTSTTTTSSIANEKKKNNDPSNVTVSKAITNVVEDENGVTKTTTTTTTTTTTKVKKITKNDPEYETTEYKFGCLCTIM